MQLYDDYDCGVVVDIYNTTSNTTSVIFYILLALTLLAAAGAVIYFYRKKLRRDVNKEMKMQVSTAVDHYFALT
jgi:preprotein translocase subunit SecY